MTQATGEVVEAGREAFEGRNWAQALEHLQTADGKGVLSADDLERLAEAARWSSRYDVMLDALERAVAAYQREDSNRGAARVALKLAIEYFVRSDDALFSGWFGRAARLLEGEDDCHERGMLLAMEAEGRSGEGDLEGALNIFREVTELGRRLGDRNVEALGLVGQGHALVVSGRVMEGVSLMDEASAAAMTGDLELSTAGRVFCETIFSCRNRGDWRRAGEWSDASLRWCERNSLSFFPGLCRFHRAEVLRVQGRYDEAERETSAAADELMEAAPRFAAWAVHEIGEINRRRGNRAAARESFERAAELGTDPQPGLSLLMVEEGKRAPALRAIKDHLGEEDLFSREARPHVLPAAVRIGIAAGELDFAREAATELKELAEKLDTDAVRASALVADGELALAESREEDATKSLRRGWKLWAQSEAPYEAAEGRVLLADAYRALGDPDSAEVELKAALATFERIGAEGQAHRVSELLAPSAAAVRAQRTFMFTDIVDSTKLVEVLGDEAWESMLAWHDRTMRQCIEERDGEIVGQEGDGWFVAFGDAHTALDCACDIQRTLHDHRREHGFAPSLRIGLHVAEATDRGGGYSGLGVHAAARVGAAAKGGEIVASQDTLDAADGRFTAKEPRDIEAKGIAEPITVASVAWSEEG